MDNLLCDFARRFPDLAAEILHRDTHKRRNFREESITDVLMAGLTAFEPFGVRVDFPEDESKTGQDMDWEFVQPNALDGRRYLRLHIQAKRAIQSTTKDPYWFYRELDHAVPKGAQRGTQHDLLVQNAKLTPGCVAMYMFYHPRSALSPADASTKGVEGVNLIFADLVPSKLTAGRWPIEDRKLETWRKHFCSLHDVLCFANGPIALPLPSLPEPDDHQLWLFSVGPGGGFYSPGELADRLNERRGDTVIGEPVKAVGDIPSTTIDALRRRERFKRLPGLERPRAIFGPWISPSD